MRFIHLFFLCFVFVSYSTIKAQEGQRPNIVLMVADDHGQGDLGCYGNEAIRTPNLDKLAGQGIRFNNAYCTSASCSASRSVILTGIQNHANGQYGHAHTFHHFQAFEYISSLPVYLEKYGGYATARAGKYHVAPEDVFYFQHELGEGGFNPVALADSCESFIKNTKSPFFLYYATIDPHRRGGVVQDNPYKPDRFGNLDEGYEGVEEIKFSYKDVIVPSYLPDTREAREELAQYYQSVARLDQGAGRLLNHIKEAGVWDNTIIMYISDNGIAFPGAKTNVYEPAINLPCIIKPAHSRSSSVSDAYISWADITPTLLEVAGILPQVQNEIKEKYNSIYETQPWAAETVVKEFHGQSFYGLLQNKAFVRDTIFASHTFHEITMYYPMRAIITPKYKLIWNIASGLPYPHAADLWESSTWQSVANSPGQLYAGRKVNDYSYRPAFELYNLENDPLELVNLAENPDFADVLEELKTELKAFQKRTNDPWIMKWEHE